MNPKNLRKIITILSLTAISLFSRVNAHSINNIEIIKNDSVAVIVEKKINYDSLLSVWYKNNIYSSYDKFTTEFIDIDLDETFNPKEILADSIYAQRLDMLATAIQLPYNEVVKSYIGVYTIKNREYMARLMGLAQYYMPIIEQELDLEGVPDELKIVPIIESGLNPRAMSPVGAGGLWQFMMRTGKSYGLEIDSFVDERMDPIKSTRVAIKYMKELYKIYEDWTLVIAAYNCGPGNVNKAISRAGNARTYWDIYNFLPRETRNHIPAFIAATYAYTFHKAHGIEPTMPPYQIATDTIMVNKMMHFDQISSTLGISNELIQNFNPQYKLDIIPAKEKEYALILPINDILSFVEHEKEIYAKDTTYLKSYLGSSSMAATALKESQKKMLSAATVTYKVKSGDNLGAIARRYGTTAQKIMYLNGITNPKRLRIGQVLKIK
ncbi:MAG: transglycosylase SLT domain-containing protein [Rikenellaceae bacterium]